MSTTVNASVFADVISFSWKFRPPGFWWVTHSSFNMEKKCFPRLLGDLSNYQGQNQWAFDRGDMMDWQMWVQKMFAHTWKNTPFAWYFASKINWIKPWNNILVQKTHLNRPRHHILRGPCDCFKICVELNGTICSWQRQRFDTWRSNSSS